jgi:NDP-sugar pyrophosphorylase family protein
MLQCVVLAGGLATRMRPHTDRVPKSLLPVAGRPFAELQLQWLANEGVDSVVYCVGHRGHQLRAALGTGESFGLSIRYADEGNQLRGTGGALRLALDEGLLNEAFFVLKGDSYLSVNLADVAEAWRVSGLPALMTVYRNQGRWDASNAVLESGQVRYEKPWRRRDVRPDSIDYGLLVLDRTIVETRIPPDSVVDLASVMQDLGSHGLLAGFEATERFYEIGSPSGLAELEAHLAAAAVTDA